MPKQNDHGFQAKKINIPNNNDWVLVLRYDNPWNVKDGRSVYNSGHRIEDVASPGRFVVQDLNAKSPRKEKKGDGAGGGDIWQTTFFPLNGRGEGGDKVLRHDRTLNQGTVHARNEGKHGFQRHAFNKQGFSGVGYDLNVAKSDTLGGTPGYDNGAVKSASADLDGMLTVSELMLTTDNGRYPQWIELHNTSRTRSLSLGDPDGDKALKPWRIVIENHNSGTWKSENRPLHVTINLSDWFSHIGPNQTRLIVSTTARNSDGEHFPSNRVASVFGTKKSAFKMANRRDMFLNAAGGFIIQILDPAGTVIDQVGNLDGKAYDVRKDVPIDDPDGFEWPTALTEDGDRSSLIRLQVSKTDKTPRVGVPTRDADGNATDKQGQVAPMGSLENRRGGPETAWVHASDLALSNAQNSWYGSKDDIGTPGHIAGTPLAVSLSFFRPALEDGAVVIRWTTESEIDNAGFNIYRSESRDGEFQAG